MRILVKLRVGVTVAQVAHRSTAATNVMLKLFLPGAKDVFCLGLGVR